MEQGPVEMVVTVKLKEKALFVIANRGTTDSFANEVFIKSFF